jgi:hypothetical protein
MASNWWEGAAGSSIVPKKKRIPLILRDSLGARARSQRARHGGQARRWRRTAVGTARGLLHFFVVGRFRPHAVYSGYLLALMPSIVRSAPLRHTHMHARHILQAHTRMRTRLRGSRYRCSDARKQPAAAGGPREWSSSSEVRMRASPAAPPTR